MKVVVLWQLTRQFTHMIPDTLWTTGVSAGSSQGIEGGMERDPSSIQRWSADELMERQEGLGIWGVL